MRNFNTFLGLTADEIHAFAIGLFEVICPWKPRILRIPLPLDYIQGEYHYYLAGRALGFPMLLLILIALCKLGKELLL